MTVHKISPAGCFDQFIKLTLWFFGIMFLLYFLGVGNRSDRAPSAATSSNAQSRSVDILSPLPTDTPPPTATPLPDWMALPFDAICGHNATMTDIQQEDLAKSQIGRKAVNWTGAVYDVEHDYVNSDGSMFVLQVDMEDDIFSSRQVEIIGIDSTTARMFNVNQKIAFDGTISDIGNFASDICNPVTITGAVVRILP